MTPCFTHSDCSDAQKFCAWTIGLDGAGESYPCGACKPCSECLCDTDSADFQCPPDRCPAQPINAVRFLQGLYFNRSVLGRSPDYSCVRRLVVTGSVFSITQIPLYNRHPATTALFNESDILSFICPSYTRSGILKSTSKLINGTLKLVAVISSEGVRARSASTDFTFADASASRGSIGGVGSAAQLPLRPAPRHPSRRPLLQRYHRELQQLA